jgi:F-type H+-transporting ATPase subunit delta
MVNVSVARRYARALLEVAAESGDTEKASEQLEGFSRAMQESEELSGVLLNPAFTRSQRSAVLEGILTSSGLANAAVGNFLRLLSERNRLSQLPDIARAFHDMADARAGRMRGRVWSAHALPKESLQKLRQALERITQRSIVLDTKVDPSLLGGVAAQVGPVMYDGSLKTQLEELRRTLSSR